MRSYEKKLVSIVVPSYNYGQYLKECIESLLAQTYKNIELIIVDDGSTDNTKEIVFSYDDSRINYIYKDNNGLSAARNTGIDNISGDYVLFLDSDDLIENNYVSRQVDFLEKKPMIDIGVARNRLFKRLTWRAKPDTFGSWRLYSKHLEDHLLFFNLAPPHCYFYRRHVIDKVSYFDSSLEACEDYDYVLRCVRERFRLGINRKALVYYRVHPSSMSANKERQYYYDSILHERIVGYFFEEGSIRNQDLTPYYPFLAGVVVTVLRLHNINVARVKHLLGVFQKFLPYILSDYHIDNLVKLQYFLLLRKLVRRLNSSIDVYSELSSYLHIVLQKKVIFGDYFLLFGDLLKPSNFDLLTVIKIANEVVRIKKIACLE